MKKKRHELLFILGREIMVDISFLINHRLFFNGTDMAKPFSIKPVDWLRFERKAYIAEFLKVCGTYFENVVRTQRGGKYAGTWLHQNLAIAFDRCLSIEFSVRLDMRVKEKFLEYDKWERRRIDSKTGFRPFTDAIQATHENPQHFHYNNEINLINRIVTGFSTKEFCKERHVDNTRDGMSADQLDQLEKLQRQNTSLIELGFPFKERKRLLAQTRQN